MHISEGVLSAPVLVSGAALAAAGTAVGLKKLNYDRIPQVALLAAAFFIASLIHVPVGPASAHLVLNGLLGLLLGWAAFPAILIALALQAVLFQFGGLTTLGINTLNMALPAVVCFGLFSAAARSESPLLWAGASFLCGLVGVALASLMVALALVFTGQPFLAVAKLVVAAHVPVMIIEGLVVCLVVGFLKKVRPELLEVAYAR